MSEIARLVVIVGIGAGVVWLLWWLLIETEGVYLGRRVVVWLYDLYAGRYDDIKHFRSEYDHMFLAQPLMQAVAPQRNPLVLDVAAGTGRLSLALLRHTHFNGRVIGVDFSRRMLRIAAAKLGDDPRAPLVWCPAEALPFPDDTFDAVTCLEALEFMERPAAVIAEITRVLRPGGCLLITNRINTRLMPGKTWSSERVQQVLTSAGLVDIALDHWQVDYNRVWARKAGSSQPAGARPLLEVLRCPNCRRSTLNADWCCPVCGQQLRVAEDGVLEVGSVDSQP